MLLGVVYALIAYTLDTRIRSAADLRRMSSAPMLGSLPVVSAKGQERVLYVRDDPFGPASEAVKKVRTNLLFVNATSDNRHTCLVTSASPGEGKTTTVINLGLALAESGRRVLIIDADLRRPRIAEALGLEGAVGLTTVLVGDAEPEDVIQPWQRSNLSVLAGGEIPPNPSELLGSGGMRELMRRMGREFDFVLIDTPPVLPVTDAIVLSELVGSVLAVVSADTRRRELQEALRAFETSDVKVSGLVMTKTAPEGRNNYYYNYGGAADLQGRAAVGAGRRRRSKVKV